METLLIIVLALCGFLGWLSAISLWGHARLAERLPLGTKQWVVASYTLDGRSYAVLRRWGSKDAPVMFEIQMPPLAAETSVIFWKRRDTGQIVVSPQS